MSQLLFKSKCATRQSLGKVSGSGVRRRNKTPFQQMPQSEQQHQQGEMLRCFSSPPAMEHNQYEGYAVKELSVTADLIQTYLDEKEQPGALRSENWVADLIQQHPQSKVVFSAHGDGHSMPQHLSTGLSGDHLVS